MVFIDLCHLFLSDSRAGDGIVLRGVYSKNSGVYEKQTQHV